MRKVRRIPGDGRQTVPRKTARETRDFALRINRIPGVGTFPEGALVSARRKCDACARSNRPRAVRRIAQRAGGTRARIRTTLYLPLFFSPLLARSRKIRWYQRGAEGRGDQISSEIPIDNDRLGKISRGEEVTGTRSWPQLVPPAAHNNNNGDNEY